MADAVAARTASSTLVLLLRPPPTGSTAEDDRAAANAAAATTAPDRSDAVILDLSEEAQAALARGDAGDQAASSAKTDDRFGQTRIEKRFKLLTEYTALQQELAWLSGRAAAYALDELFQGKPVRQDESDAADERAQYDRDVQRRDELMPRFAELTRLLRAPPGLESPDEAS